MKNRAAAGRRPLRVVYEKLFEIAEMRRRFAAIRTDVAASDAHRFELNLQQLEALALGVIETIETQQRVATH